MIYHLRPVEYYCRIWDRKEGDPDALFAAEEPYDGNLIVRVVADIAFVEMLQNKFDFAVYRGLRDELHGLPGVTDIEWTGGGRIRKPKRRQG